MFATKNKSVKGKKCCQVFVGYKGCIAVQEVGMPVDLIVDGFSAQKKYQVIMKSSWHYTQDVRVCHSVGKLS